MDHPEAEASITSLTPDLLEQFNESLRAIGAPIVEVWAPGLNDDRIDALLVPVGIDVPEEARVWWRWHDGTRDDQAPIVRVFGDGRYPLSLKDVADLYDETGAACEEVWGIGGLLSPFPSKPEIYFDCTGPRDRPVPIYTQDDIETPRVVLPSIGELVRAWIDVIEAGGWTVKPDGTWDIHSEKIPTRLSQLRIA